MMKRISQVSFAAVVAVLMASCGSSSPVYEILPFAQGSYPCSCSVNLLEPLPTLPTHVTDDDTEAEESEFEVAPQNTDQVS